MPGIKMPKRVDYMRIIIMELARITDHIICNGVLGVDTGAFTGFLYLMEYRESIYEIYEEVCGSRLTTNMGRIGGFERNFSNVAFEKLEKFMREYFRLTNNVSHVVTPFVAGARGSNFDRLSERGLRLLLTGFS